MRTCFNEAVGYYRRNVKWNYKVDRKVKTLQ